MEFSFEAKVVVTMDHEKGSPTSKHVATDFNLFVDDNLDKSVYLSPDGMPTETGSIVLSHVLVHGLVGNIHLAHQSGFRDSAEHLRWIISELEKGFVSVANVSKGEF